MTEFTRVLHLSGSTARKFSSKPYHFVFRTHDFNVHNRKLPMYLPLRYSVFFIPLSHQIYTLHSIQDSVIIETPVSTNQSTRKSCFSSSRFWGRSRGDNFILRKIGVTSNALSGKRAYLIDFSDCRRIMDGPDCVSPRGRGRICLSHFERLFHVQRCVECSGMTGGICWTHFYEEKSRCKRYSTLPQK